MPVLVGRRRHVKSLSERCLTDSEDLRQTYSRTLPLAHVTAGAQVKVSG